MQWAIGSAGSVWLVSIVGDSPLSRQHPALFIFLQILNQVTVFVVLLDLHSVICQHVLTKCHYDSYDWHGHCLKGPDTVLPKKTFSVDKGWCWNAILVQFNALVGTRVWGSSLKQNIVKCMVDIKCWPYVTNTQSTNWDTTKHKYTIVGQVHHWYKMLAVTNCWPHVVSRPLTWCGLWPLPPLSSHPM